MKILPTQITIKLTHNQQQRKLLDLVVLRKEY